MRADILKPGLKALYYSGAHKLLAPFSQGIGLIFMLHRVSPEPPGDFAPNRGLMVTPSYLDSVLRDVRKAGLDIISLDEACERIRSGNTQKRFACFTLDDGYKDNLQYARPVFKAHEAPFTIYIPSDYPSGKGELWWVALEEVIARNESVEFDFAAGSGPLPAETVEQKKETFNRLYGYLRHRDQEAQRNLVRRLCETHDVDMAAICRDLIMTWDEVRELASDPLVTIGAHTVAHYALAQLPEENARREMKVGADRLAKKIGYWPAHLSYPYGDRRSAGPREFRIAAKLGFRTAVTTRKGVLFPDHAQHLTALPRVSLNGDYQGKVFTQLFITGAPFAIWNGFRKVNAA